MVEIVASERTRGSIRLGMLAQLFGGGYLVVRGLRAKEALEKLEREFWVYVEEKVAHLAGSAEHTQPPMKPNILQHRHRQTPPLSYKEIQNNTQPKPLKNLLPKKQPKNNPTLPQKSYRRSTKIKKENT